MVKTLFQIAFFSNLLLVVLSAHANKMDLDTHTAVIERLKVIVKDLDDRDVSKVPAALRLADLLAERSRLKAMKEVEQNCDNCLKSKEDRKLALGYYEFVVPRLTDDIRGSAMLQKAHLHFALGEIKETEQIYKQIEKESRKKHSGLVLGQAIASLGDVYFQKADFKNAKIQYEKSLKIVETPQKGLVHYRLSWCLFNLDRNDLAITKLEMILQTPQLTTIVTDDGLKQDESFKIDVAKDLATFYARTKITQQTIDNVVRLSPESQKQQNLYFLASEADRLGKKKESALVWSVYLAQDGSNKNELEAQIRIMKLKSDMGKMKEALIIFANIQKLWQDPGCADKCEDLQAKIKNWITGWNREEKKQQTKELTQAYIMYTALFPEDEEMLIRGAVVAHERKQNEEAFQLYRQAAEVSYQKLSNNKLNKSERSQIRDSFEHALIGEIDMSETLKNSQARLAAYKHYLSLNPQGAREFEVRYQMAQVTYESKKYSESAIAFHSLALEKIQNKRQLQLSAAQMSMESLIAANEEQNIEKYSLDFIKAFPESRQKFSAMHRKSVLNVVARKINNKSADQKDLFKLHTVSLLGASVQEQVSLYKNTYILALRLENFPEAKVANQKLYSLKGISQKDKDESYHNKIWLAELELDFKTAYSLTKAQKSRITADRSLRLIWLSEMAGLNPETHEKEFLNLSHNRSLRATVIAHYVGRQRNPQKSIKPYLNELSQSPDILGKLALEIYSKTNNSEILEQANKYRSIRINNLGPIIGRLLYYKELDKKAQKLTQARLNSRSDKLLKKSLSERLTLIGQMEKEGQKAIHDKDPVLQAITLDILRMSYFRLYNDILKLPLPRGLNKQQQKQYGDLLLAQANPYKAKGIRIEEKLTDLWTTGAWSEQIGKVYEESRFEYKPALRQDISHLVDHAPNPYKSRLQNSLQHVVKIPSEKAVAQVRNQIKKNPFETEYVKELKELESRRGNDFVVSHLEARLQQMKGMAP